MPDRIKTIQEYLKTGSQASDKACYSAAQFIIGNALHRCYFEDGMGKVKTNLSYVWASPSSTFKTPLLRILIEIYNRELREQGIHFKSKFTTEGLMNFLNAYREKYEKEGKEVPIFRCNVYRDEASNLAKEAKGGRAANIWEFLSQCFDGSIDPYDTVRGKDQHYPEVWFSFWFSSTLSLYQHLSDDFWEQGFAFRCLFIKPEKKNYSPMTGEMERQTTIEGISNEIAALSGITRAFADNEWWNRFNQFVEPIVERGNDEIDNLNRAENSPIEAKAEKKYPEMVIKLSMIHCASRDGWKEAEDEGIKIKYLWLELQDIENAIADLWKYKESFIAAYNTYQFKKKNPAKLEKIDEERRIVLKILEESPPEERYDYREEYGDDKKLHVYAYKTPEGKCVKLSYIYRKTNWNKMTVKNVLGAMVYAEEIELPEVESEGTKKKTTLVSDAT